jgi:hypothetical protein
MMYLKRTAVAAVELYDVSLLEGNGKVVSEFRIESTSHKHP